jgi:hypothetical protein
LSLLLSLGANNDGSAVSENITSNHNNMPELSESPPKRMVYAGASDYADFEARPVTLENESAKVSFFDIDGVNLRSQSPSVQIIKEKSYSEISLVPSPLHLSRDPEVGPRISTTVLSEVSHTATSESNAISAPNSNASNITVTTSSTNALGNLERPMSLMKQITSLITGVSNQTSLIEDVSPLTEHMIPGSSVVIREDEISSLIAFTLL